MKKVVLIALCVLMLIGTVSAENYEITWEGGGATCGAALTWTVEGSTLYITGTGEMYDFPTGAPWSSYRSSITQVVLSGGVVAEQGTPEELYRQNGLYTHMVQLQTASQSWTVGGVAQ